MMFLTALTHSLRTDWHRWVPVAFIHVALVVYLCVHETLGIGLWLINVGMLAGQLLDDLHGRPRAGGA